MKHIEVEGGEIILKNSYGDISVIPTKDRAKIESMVSNGRHGEIDEYVSNLPKYNNYAVDGTIVGDPPYLGIPPISDYNKLQTNVADNTFAYKVPGMSYEQLKNQASEVNRGLVNKEREKQQRALEIEQSRKGVTMVSGMKNINESDHAKNESDYAKRVADYQIEQEHKPFIDKVTELGTDIALNLIPEIGMAKYVGNAAKVVNAANKVDDIVPIVNKSEDLISSLRNELKTKGIIEQQKTPNLPWKEPIRKGIEPFGYDAKTGSSITGSSITGSKFKDLKGAIFGGKNPLYMTDEQWLEKQTQLILDEHSPFNSSNGPLSEKFIKDLLERSEISREPSLKKAIDIRDKQRIKTIDKNLLFTDFGTNLRTNLLSNRYTTWDMYLGKPQNKHPMYDISELTKSKDKIVYTIKEDFMDKPLIEEKINEMISNIEVEDKYKIKIDKKRDSHHVADDDRYFGTMGGFHWDIKKLDDGNYKVMANDLWDLQPFKEDQPLVNSVTGRIIHQLSKPIGNIEVGKALGIGKPLDVQVGFIVNGKTKKIINTFGLAGASVAGTKQINNKE